jgi:putative transposase|tara:strand:+ start:999 stop:1190 length:192 start_codon:yes stop_codon:yes gene_type:complete
MDEVYIVTVRVESLYLWRAVDQDEDVLDIPIQKLMKGQERSAWKIVTDKLASYGATRKTVMPT